MKNYKTDWFEFNLITRGLMFYKKGFRIHKYVLYWGGYDAEKLIKNQYDNIKHQPYV